MHISYGTSRFVIAVPSCGIVIKIARVRIVYALREFPNYIKNYDIWSKVDLQYPRFITPLGYLVRGIIENFGERRFYRVTKNPLLQPTYFSLLGLASIQKYSEPLEGVDISLIRKMLLDISARDKRILDDSHHFSNSRNFARDERGKLRMLDYGLKGTQEIIFAYGARLHREFVFPTEPE